MASRHVFGKPADAMWLWILFCLAAIFGCASPSPPRQPVHYPITSGFHKTLPRQDTRIFLWGKQPVIGTATIWLQTHGLTVILPDQIYRHVPAEEQNWLTYTSEDAPVVLHRGKSIDAELIMFADFEISAEPASRVRGDFQPTYTVDVTLRGVDVRTGEVQWKGNAHYPPLFSIPPNSLGHLTCQALATAWGFRPSGQLEVPSHMMCTTGQTEPALSP